MSPGSFLWVVDSPHVAELTRRGRGGGGLGRRGAVEGACKRMVLARLRDSGMWWELATAEPVMQVRAALLTEPRLNLRGYAARKPAVAAA